MSLKSIYYTNDENLVYEEKMKNIFKIQMCKRVLKNETNTSSGVPFFKIGTFGSIPDSYISKEMFLLYKQKYNYPRVGEVLISCSGTVGKCVIFDGNDAYFQDSNILWFRNDELKVLNSYLYYYLSSYRWNKQNSSTITRIYKKDLEDIIVIFPNFDLQYKISEIISSIDNLISNKNAMVTKLNELKFELLDAVIYNHGLIKFEDDKLKWQKKKIIDVSICLDHLRTAINSNDRQHIKGEYPYFGANNIQGYLNKYTFDGEIVLLAEDGGNFSDFKSRGIAQYYSGKCCVNNHTHVLIGKDSTKFLYFSLVHKDIRKYVNGSSRAKLNKSDMLKIEIDIPEIKIQNKISDILTSMDKLIELEEKKLEKLELMKKYYMQQFFD